jgi:hypothetical protein
MNKLDKKICKVCNIEKDLSSFVKWKRTCRKCDIENNKKWKEKNRKIIKSNCIDCNIEYETVIYSTEIPNIRCRKCSIRSKKVILTNKTCKICEINKSIDDFYRGNICKKCLFKKRNERYYQRLKEDFLFRIKHNLKVSFKKNIKSFNTKKDSKMIEIIGCSIDDLKIHIESKFEDWMNWENYGKYNGKLNYGWDIDHIIPISSSNDSDELKKLYNYTNLQPLCSKVNRDIKKDKINYEN